MSYEGYVYTPLSVITDMEILQTDQDQLLRDQGPVVERVVSLTSSLRVISLTILADSIHNILIFFAKKM